MKFKVGDQIIITSGKDKGKTSEITKVFPKKNRVQAKGVNQYKRHIKSREGIEGGIITIERPLPLSKIAILDPVTKKASRIGYKLVASGTKTRISKDSGADLDKKPKTTTKSKSSKK